MASRVVIQIGMMSPRGNLASRRISHAMPTIMSTKTVDKTAEMKFEPKSGSGHSMHLVDWNRYAVPPAVQNVSADRGATTLNRMMSFEQQPKSEGSAESAIGRPWSLFVCRV